MRQANESLIQEKLDSILRCLARIRKWTPSDLTALESDIDAQDIIAVNLERAVQASVDVAAHIIAYTPLPAAPTMADSFLTLSKAGLLSERIATRMRKSVGLRNILVHEYRRLDWSVIWAVTQTRLGDFEEFVSEIHGALSRGLNQES